MIASLLLAAATTVSALPDQPAVPAPPPTSESGTRTECVASAGAPGIFYVLTLTDGTGGQPLLVAVDKVALQPGHRIRWSGKPEARPLITVAKTGRQTRGGTKSETLLRRNGENFEGTHDFRIHGDNLIMVAKENRALELDITFGLRREDRREDRRVVASPVAFAGNEVKSVVVYACGNVGASPGQIP